MVQNKVKDTRRPGAPGWKGPAIVPKAPTRHINPHSREGRAIAAANVTQWTLPFELQQLLLNIFRNSYAEVLASDDLVPTLQEIKTALFERDFAAAFGQPRYLEAYTARWSPSRALCYGSALVDLRAHLDSFSLFAQSERSWSEQKKADENEARGIPGDVFDTCTAPATRVVCIGGGAAEVVGFGGALRYMLSSSGAAATEARADVAEPALPADASEQDIMDHLARATARLALPTSTPPILDLHLVDSADWSCVASTLHTALTTPPPVSKYASAAARAVNSPLLPASSARTTFHHADVLALSAAELAALTTPPGDGPRPCIVTMLFTLNELYSASISRTTALLLKLTMSLVRGSVLLVIDSPGSYSEAAVGPATAAGPDGAVQEKKKYPMSWLLDHALLPKEVSKKEREEARRRGEEPPPAEWEKLVGEEARWFRLREGLGYPISLENMRYQVHVFRRL